MKIAQVVSTYPPYRGGMGKVAHEYTERLRARGHHVHVFTPAYRFSRDDVPYVHRVPSPVSIGNAGFTPSLFQRLRGFDVVHLHYPFFGGAEPIIVRRALRDDQKLVLTYHMDSVADGAKGWMFRAHEKLLLPWILSRADKIFVSSRDYASSSALARQENVTQKIDVHPFGVDLDLFHPGEEPAVRQELGVRADMPLVLFVGGLDRAHAFKGLSVLLRALASLARYPWHAVVIGEGDLRAVYELDARERGLSDRVHFLGSVPDERLPVFYRASDVHCFPSTARSEAFGLVALEAAASGIPTIASDLPGVRQVVLNGETGLLVAPGDVESLTRALTLLLEQVDLRRRLGFSARKRAEAEFAWEPKIDALERAYLNMVK